MPMKRFVVLPLLTLTLVLFSSIGIVSAQVSDLTVSITQNVNIRDAPSVDGERLGALARGTNFRIDGRIESGEWIRGITERGTVGWIVSGPTGLSLSEIIGLRIITPDTPFRLSPPSSGAPPPRPAASNNQPSDSNDTASAPSAPLVNAAPVAGFDYGGHIAGFDGAAYSAMNRAGMSWIKKQLRVGAGQGAGQASGWISNAHGNGFRILIGAVGNASEVNSPGYYERYASTVAAIAAAGADAIEIWNEPNISREWPSGQIDPVAYTELLRVSYNAIKQANPNTIVISGAPAPTGAEGAFPGDVMNDDRFVRGMAAAGAANYMDCVGVHYNEGIVPPTATSGDPRNPSNYYTRYLPSMIDVYYNAFGGAVPLCFTELGYLSPEGYGGLSSAFSWASNTTVAQQAAWVDGAVSYSANSGRVRLVIIWNINFTNFGQDPMAGYAIIRPDGSCPACDALAR